MASNVELLDFDTVKKDLEDSKLKYKNVTQLGESITEERDKLTQENYYMKNEIAAMEKQKSEYNLKIQEFSKKTDLNVIEENKTKMRKDFFKNFSTTVYMEVPNVQKAEEKYKYELNKKQELALHYEDLLTIQHQHQSKSELNEEKFTKTQQDILAHMKLEYPLSNDNQDVLI